MDERERIALQNVHDSLLREGFSRDWSKSAPTYAGVVKIDNLSFSISVEIPDFDFVAFPIIRYIDTVDASRKKLLAHVIGSGGSVCYLDPRTAVLDRYNPDGIVLGCIEQAKKVLSAAIRGKSDDDIRLEFFAYWSPKSIYVDLPNPFEGKAVIYAVKWRHESESVSYVLCPETEPKGWTGFTHRIKAEDKIFMAQCAALTLSSSLEIDSGFDWPPQTLSRLLIWLKEKYPLLVPKIQSAINSGTEKEFWLSVTAPNCMILFRFEVPPQYCKPEFLKNRRSRLFSLLESNGATVKLERYVGRSLGEEYLFKRNMFRMNSLSGKTIALIGCGTIGGFLAQQLAKVGAGTGQNGHLLLIDNDTLEPPNLGRHLLGMPYLGMNKAEACKGFIEQQIPYVTVSACTDNALSVKNDLLKYDLIVDATGEEALSIALNDFVVHSRPDAPPMLFIYLVGNGAAAQGIFCPSNDYACYKCEKTDLSKPARHSVLKKGTEIAHDANYACGDSAHVSFPISRSSVAAALALEMVIGWANNRPKPHFRTRVLDQDLANQSHDGNPEPSTSCPACRS